MLIEPSLMSNIWFAFGIFAGMVVILHAALVYAWPLNELQWRRADYVWLALASLSLIGAVGEDRRFESENAYEFNKPALTRAADDILEEVQFGRHHNCDMPFVRSPYSPPNFDEIQNQRLLACEWFRNAVNVVTRVRASDNPVYGTYLLRDSHKLTDTILRQDIDRTFHLLADAQIIGRRLEVLKRASEKTDFDTLVILASPILLAFALALRITKVTGELRLAGRKARQEAPPSIA